jgi:DNA-binding protein Fis
MIEQDVTIDPKSLDLSQNFKSFKVSLYKQLIKKSLTPQDIEDVLYDFFLKNLDGKNEYRDHISIYEKPLITAGLKKYKSQLQLADVLGLNRNTLRKKINELNLD